jgi:hypothetical protein
MTNNDKFNAATDALLDRIATGMANNTSDAIRNYAEAYKALAEGRAWETIPNQSH